MSQRKKRNKNRALKGTFAALPHRVLDSEAYRSLSCKSVKCLIDIYRQYDGFNNGDLSCTFSLMRKRGWKSKSHLDNAKNELIEKGFVVLTRRGGRHKCNLYAVTWQPIDECKGKIDRKPTTTPLGYWQKGINPELDRVGDKLISMP